MKKTLRRLLRRPLRLDRAVEPEAFDLELVHRGFRESLLARLFRRPARYVRGETPREG